jgi:hypothetical protein
LRIRAMLKKIGKLVPEYSENPEILTELVQTHRMVG